VKIVPLGTMPGGAIFERMDKTIIVNGKLENEIQSRNNEK